MKITAIMIICLLLTSCGGGSGETPPVVCTMDAKTCPDGSYVVRTPPSCEFAPCPNEIVFETSCASDADCRLINRSYGYGCCWAGACTPLDYSKDDWIAVNASWFSTGRAKFCLPQNSCGPQPGCPFVIVNDRFKPGCSDHNCRKMPLSY